MRGHRELADDLFGLRHLVEAQQLGVDAVHLSTQEGGDLEHRWVADTRRFTGPSLRTAEVSRLGRAFLDHGRINGRQVVPAALVQSMPTETVPTGGYGSSADISLYGLHVWPCGRAGAWRMEGEFGQLCVVMPSQGTCVTVTAADQGCTCDILQGIWSVLAPGRGARGRMRPPVERGPAKIRPSELGTRWARGPPRPRSTTIDETAGFVQDPSETRST